MTQKVYLKLTPPCISNRTSIKKKKHVELALTSTCAPIVGLILLQLLKITIRNALTFFPLTF